jgi:putative transposase
VKYEDVYLHEYADGDEALASLRRYWRFYNQMRKHQALRYRTPTEVYFAERRASAAARSELTGAT